MPASMSFGRPLLRQAWRAPEITCLNHGTVGPTPRVVLEAQPAWQRRIEAQPARFLFRAAPRRRRPLPPRRPSPPPVHARVAWPVRGSAATRLRGSRRGLHRAIDLARACPP